jgi:hypothetical protein
VGVYRRAPVVRGHGHHPAAHEYPTGGEEEGHVGLILGSLVFLAVWAPAVSRPFLKELASRGHWVPPGAARHPVLVALATPVLIIATGGAVMGVMIWVMQLCGLVG